MQNYILKNWELCLPEIQWKNSESKVKSKLLEHS